MIGQAFFASRFDFKDLPEAVRIDLSSAHFWDSTAVNALDKIVLKFRRASAALELIGLNEAGATLVHKSGVH